MTLATHNVCFDYIMFSTLQLIYCFKDHGHRHGGFYC